MANILKSIETTYIDAQTLLNLLANYRRPREHILRMVKNKELIRLKNGFYLITDKITQGAYTIIPLRASRQFALWTFLCKPGMGIIFLWYDSRTSTPCN